MALQLNSLWNLLSRGNLHVGKPARISNVGGRILDLCEIALWCRKKSGVMQHWREASSELQCKKWCGRRMADNSNLTCRYVNINRPKHQPGDHWPACCWGNTSSLQWRLLQREDCWTASWNAENSVTQASWDCQLWAYLALSSCRGVHQQQAVLCHTCSSALGNFLSLVLVFVI